MNGLVIVASKAEIAPSFSFLKTNGIAVCVTGIGGMPAGYAIAKETHRKKPDWVIQAGIAGCFDKKVALGEVFVIEEDHFGDVGVVENGEWRSVFDLHLLSKNELPFKNGILINPHKALLAQTALTTVKGVTVNEISTSWRKISQLKKKGILLESMEGAALHYVALMEKIPYLQIRSVSNYVGERDKTKWIMKQAINNVNKELKRIILTLM